MSLNLDKSTWKRITFSDVAKNHNNYFVPERDGALPFVAGPHIDPGEISIVRYGSTTDDDFPPTFKRMFQPGDVLLHSRGIEKVGVVDRSGVTGEKLFVLRTLDSDVLDQRFLPWLLASQTAADYFTANFSGSVNKFLNWRPLAAMEFDLPPLDEQQRLADLLWALERHRLSIRERADRAWDAAAVALRHAWEAERKVTVGDIGECVTGSTPSKANVDYWNSEDVPFYTPSEIDGEFIASARQQVSLAGAKAGRMLPKNAVAVACIGGDLGKSAVVIEPGISNQQITSVIGLPADDAELLQAVLAHPLGRAALKARETTTIVRKLNKSDLMKVKVPWPADRTTLHTVIRARRTAIVSANVEASRLASLQSGLTAEIFGGAE
ncbi:restriction endonuclease subunit S (plasmid) [Streptomyces hirsutus]|uniref:restriction endonuclease subunit S n=1 Tax=Streptomyces hirsutus TaxID=35620 RepID=UPI002F9088C0|nr:restriction endonuclease subunit S [Streptomyces hirsutus]